MIDRLIAAVARQKKDDKGFSLIELLVVVVIIGILAAIAIPIFLNQRQAAWRGAVESDVANARLAVETALTQVNGNVGNLTFPGETTGTDGAGAVGDITKTGATGSDPLSQFSVSPDVSITIEGADGNYTVEGSHAQLDTTEVYTFDSSDGSSSW